MERDIVKSARRAAGIDPSRVLGARPVRGGCVNEGLKVRGDGRYGWSSDNVIGSLPQPNRWTADWGEFWAELRIRPLARELRARVVHSRGRPHASRPELGDWAAALEDDYALAGLPHAVEDLQTPRLEVGCID